MYYDLTIIGAGPCGLSIAARLREQLPSALYTDDEHSRYFRRHKQHNNSLEREIKRRKGSAASGYSSEAINDDVTHIGQSPSIVVLDANSDQWLSSWKQKFKDLQIKQLRSPLFFHPDPRDRDGLLAYGHEQERTSELDQITNVIGKEISKHGRKRERSRKPRRTTARHLRADGRDQIDYFTPSTSLFEDYCLSVIQRYQLESVVQQFSVQDISYDPCPAGVEHGLFIISGPTGEVIFSRIVIVATGPSSKPCVPRFDQLPCSAKQFGSITHVFGPGSTQLPSHVYQKLRSTQRLVNLLVIGGGLTSAQLVDLFLRQHTRIRVHLLLRHDKLKCKPFDVDLPWVSKTRNHLMSTFWSAETDAERLEMLKNARNGGSVNPPFMKILHDHESSGRLRILTSAEMKLDAGCSWSQETQAWTQLNVRQLRDGQLVDVNIPDIEHIVYCTGALPSFDDIPFLDTLRKTQSLESLGGFPLINEDLMCNDEVPCFFTGALASLRLGPGAANLAGARQGAERIAWKIEEILGKREEKSRNGDKGQRLDDRDSFVRGVGNQFEALGVQ